MMPTRAPVDTLELQAIRKALGRQRLALGLPRIRWVRMKWVCRSTKTKNTNKAQMLGTNATAGIHRKMQQYASLYEYSRWNAWILGLISARITELSQISKLVL